MNLVFQKKKKKKKIYNENHYMFKISTWKKKVKDIKTQLTILLH